MEKGKLIKVVYDDDNRQKVLRGYIKDETEFSFLISCEGTKDEILLGKRYIIKMNYIVGDFQ